ncbi:hypothetical protein B4N89_10300 [Embleya scabrispora]|uniref:Integral membrane protein n=1 Tax=Embleya scabrispora TaxID=159449 RepID=A0A1T3NX02_9ACTN|nr:hypothetical protein [Embleya scabrispora]OPC81285.1 hypothetical protein B4N89_10300 [Embleya scabrispora]
MSTQSLNPTFTTGGPGGRVRGDTGLLRLALRLDAIATGVVGLAALAGCALVDGALGLPTAFLAGLGAFLVLYAVGVWRIGGSDAPHRTAVRAVIGLNLVWFADSVGMAIAGLLDPTTLGTTLIVLQAVAVLGFADVQILGLRKARTSLR